MIRICCVSGPALVRATLALAAALLLLSSAAASAQQLVWSGNVESSGQTTRSPDLPAGDGYVMVVQGEVYFGRWWQNGRDLWNDACYEFNAKGTDDPLPVFKNSLDIQVCDWTPRQGNVYQSTTFSHLGGGIEFWIEDTDYRDNSGALTVQIYRMAGVQPPPPQGDILGSWQGCDGRVITFSLEQGQYVGRYTRIGGLGTYGFTPNEVGHLARRQPDGSYVGEVKWRWTDGRQQWRPTTITIQGNTYRDTGSDNCSRQMTRM